MIPNLVSNEVVEVFARDESWDGMGRAGVGLAARYPGARLRQTGAAKLLPGLKFEAKLVLDVR